MHAVIGTVEIEPNRADEALELLNRLTVPKAKQAPGFISGTWYRSADRTRGHSVVLFESEATANTAAPRIAQGPFAWRTRAPRVNRRVRSARSGVTVAAT